MNKLAAEQELRPEALHPAGGALKTHQLPPLKFEYAALEPWIDARTMRLHHDVHHRAYVENLNAALEKFPEFRIQTTLWLLLNLDKVPEEIRTVVHHNAGGHVNHSMFWRAMKPGARIEKAGQSPSERPCEPKGGALLDAIHRDFGSFEAFKAQFEEAGRKLFGSGWVWLARPRQENGKLEVLITAGHDHPQMKDLFPILVNDVWEHAYYLQYESRRDAYLKAWWSVVDWDQAARCFDLSDNSAEEVWEDEGGHLTTVTPTAEIAG